MSDHHKPISQRQRRLKRQWNGDPEALTPAEMRKEMLRMCGDDEGLLAAVCAYARTWSKFDRFPEPECSSPAFQELPDGSTRKYVCLADYDGLVAVYRIQPSGKLVRLQQWPAWIVMLDNDPEWRARCRRLQANDRRRRARATARLDRIVASLKANAVAAASLVAAPPPAASIAPPPSPEKYYYQSEEITQEDLAMTLIELDDI